MESKTVEPQVVEAEITKELGDVLSAVEQIAQVKDPESRAVAVQWGVKLTEKGKALKELRKRIVDPIRKAYENARDTFDGKLDALEAGKKLLSARISAYDIEQERLARIEREKAEAERRRQQEEYERQQLAYKLECDHVEAIREDAHRTQIRLEDEARAARDRRLKEEEASRIRQAEAAQSLGMGDRVDTILDKQTAIAPQAPAPSSVTAAPVALPPMPVAPPPPPPPPAPVPSVLQRPDPNSIARDEWHYDVTDIRAVARAVAEGRAPVEYLTIVRSEVGKDVRRLKDAFQLPGIKTWKERNTVFRSSKGEA
jgi:hypothetical protein